MMVLPTLLACSPTAPVPATVPTASSEPEWAPPPAAGPPPPLGTNVLVLLADDLGVDLLSVYGAHPAQPPTPTITALASRGIRFENAYAYTTCSPARAALLTGRTPLSHGMGSWIEPGDEQFDLPLDEVTIPEMLDQGTLYTYSNALIGKWHLATLSYATPSWHALDQGFDWHEGSFENLGGVIVDDGLPHNYSHWEKITNGATTHVDRYATKVTVDDALELIPWLPEPWFVVVSFNAPHVPLHVPPATLHSQAVTDCDTDTRGCTRAMVEALDTELDRLLTGLGVPLLRRTTTFFTSDNGTHSHGIPPPFNPSRGKGTVFDGGVKVPLIVTSPYVLSPGATSSAFVNLVDIFPTVAEIAGVDLTQVRSFPTAPPVDIDGTSFLHLLRDGTGASQPYAYSFKLEPNGPPPWTTWQHMIRDAGHKLIRSDNAEPRLYRYDPANLDEGDDLVALGPLSATDQAAFDRLSGELDALVASLPYEGP